MFPLSGKNDFYRQPVSARVYTQRRLLCERAMTIHSYIHQNITKDIIVLQLA
ncbi:hypothetical protein ACE6H2_006279 [Prunus campanulata]